tara:strand:+ start:270 stop:419 length:150 start_codon:yes stop_codon:yes gene_type:complete
LVDICGRMISGLPVTLDERVWMNKLCEKNMSAKELAGALTCPDFVGEEL